MKNYFRTEIGSDIFRQKYALTPHQTWPQKAQSVVDEVCGRTLDGKHQPILDKSTRDFLVHCLIKQKWFPGGRYLYYAGRGKSFYNNCLLMDVKDNREGWSNLNHNTTSALMSGAGIGVEYSKLRPSGAPILGTGGTASGPISLMCIINELGRNVMQGGSRRSAIWAGLNWQHGDVEKFLNSKNWDNMVVGNTTIGELKRNDFNYPAPMDMTNISVNYDNAFLEHIYGKPFNQIKAVYLSQGTAGVASMPIVNIPEVFRQNCKQALMTGEPGFGFNFFDQVLDILRNACCEVTSADDSDICNLASINMAQIDDVSEMLDLSDAVSKFLVCGTMRADVPYEQVIKVREKNRRLGLGLMGVHEFLLKNDSNYELTPKLRSYLEAWKRGSESGAIDHCDRFYLNRPAGYRAIAPTGTIGMLAGTTTGIEPLYAAAYKRRYLIGSSDWHYQYVIDGTTKEMVKMYDIDPDKIETALTLAETPEKRIKFQADIQDYVDQAISSTINLPAWGSDLNNENHVDKFTETLVKYAPRLRGITVYPDGSRGGQPISVVPYQEAKEQEGTVFKEHDICDISGHGGSCGI